MDKPQAVFIHGILPRTGTNFLYDLLCLHPECAPLPDAYENYFLHEADHLVRYARSVVKRWPAECREGTKAGRAQQALLTALGKGVLHFMRQRTGTDSRYMITKTPTVCNLPLFSHLFPNEKLLILVRDGRATVESMVRSQISGWTYEAAMYGWAQSAGKISQFLKERNGDGRDYLVVRYERLHAELPREFAKVLRFLELDPAPYDWEKAAALPIRGSSTVARPGVRLHWRPVAKNIDFKPLERWAGWGKWRHALFNRIAGSALQSLGYQPQNDDNFSFRRWAGVGIWETALRIRRRFHRLLRPGMTERMLNQWGVER